MLANGNNVKLKMRTSSKNKNLMLNSKAQLGHGITWIAKFLILILAIGGIVTIVSAHYSKQFDIRDVETATIARKLISCIAPTGVIEDFSSEIIKKCLTLDEKELFLNISLDDKSITLGDDFTLTQCELKEKKVRLKFPPACLTEKYYVLKDGKLEQLTLFIAIKKFEKNL